MQETVLITGAHGLVAHHTAKALAATHKLRFLSRHPQAANEFAWDVASGHIDEAALDGVDYIVHLAGSKLNDGNPLTTQRQQLIWDSRIGASELLLQRLQERGQTLKAFVSASALGYYDFSDATLAIGENGRQSKGFEGELCAGWEAAADQFKTQAIAERVVKLRICLVLGRDGSLFLAFKEQLAHQPQTFINLRGATYFPWVHADDIGGMFAHAVTNPKLDGVYNTTAPQATSREALFALMYCLDRHNYPAFEQVNAHFDGQHLSSDKITQAGYQFQYPDIKTATKELML